MPTTGRSAGGFVTIGSALYYSGGGTGPTSTVGTVWSAATADLEVFYGPAVAATPAPTLSPVPSCTVTAPTNGVLGTCTSTIAAGSTCQFTCNDGYGASGTTSCHFFTGALTAATCATNVWFSRNAVPQTSYLPAQGAQSYDSFMYTYISQPLSPLGVGPAARGEFYKYSSTADTWTSGGRAPAPVPLRPPYAIGPAVV